MFIQVLVSTMNQASQDKLVKDMNVRNSVVINQLKKDAACSKDCNKVNRKFLSFEEQGLSKSRNRAIENSDADICVIADDDMYYETDYEEKIVEAYSTYKDADIIAFYVDNESQDARKRMQKTGRVNFMRSLKLSSVQLTFKLQSIVDNNVIFDERFGAGSENYMGEENIFLADCLKKGLIIYYVPIKIATLRKNSVSTWFTGYDKKYLFVKGSVFYRMSHKFFIVLIAQFALRKHKLYRKSISVFSAFKIMVQGARYEKRRNI